jgi:hypothetical protein
MRQTAAVVLLLSLATAVQAQQPTPSTDSPEPPPFKVGSGMTAPKLINHIEADVPQGAADRHHDGACSVALVVDTAGIPRNVRVVRCTDKIFAEDSLKPVQHYRFDPARTTDGKAVAVRINVRVAFHLNDQHDIFDTLNYCASSNPPISFVHFGLRSFPGISGTQPDSSGVYPLTREITPPSLKQLATTDVCEQGFSKADPLICDIPLTISDKGKAHPDGKAQCSEDTAETAAAKSLDGAIFQPAVYQGKPVAVKLIFHMVYGEPAPTQLSATDKARP